MIARMERVENLAVREKLSRRGAIIGTSSCRLRNVHRRRARLFLRAVSKVEQQRTTTWWGATTLLYHSWGFLYIRRLALSGTTHASVQGARRPAASSKPSPTDELIRDILSSARYLRNRKRWQRRRRAIFSVSVASFVIGKTMREKTTDTCAAVSLRGGSS